MRVINSLSDVQLALNDLFDWRDKLSTKSWNFHGLRITNASPSVDSNDYVIRSEIPELKAAPAQGKDVYTAVFTISAPEDSEELAAYIAGKDRDGTLEQVWAYAVTPPTTDFTYNPTINGANILTSPITIPAASTDVVVSNLFATPLPTIGYLTIIGGTVGTGGSAGLVSIGVVVRRRV